MNFLSLSSTPLFAILSAMIILDGVSGSATYGQLSVNGRYLQGENGENIQLRGMSLFWSQWMPQFYNQATVEQLKNSWKCNVVRAAIGVSLIWNTLKKIISKKTLKIQQRIVNIQLNFLYFR
jgi:hypothetical protein